MPSFTTVVAALAGCSVIVNGAAVPASAATLEARENSLSKREPVLATILVAAGTAAVSAVVSEAVSATAKFIGDVQNFDSAREAFTQQTTKEMMARNPDPARFQAAACYNQGFSVADPANIDGQNSVEFKLGLLNTDYECMYIAAPNQFFTEGDGGFINVSSSYTRKVVRTSTNDITIACIRAHRPLHFRRGYRRSDMRLSDGVLRGGLLANSIVKNWGRNLERLNVEHKHGRRCDQDMQSNILFFVW
jgi:hypothetical protein